MNAGDPSRPNDAAAPVSGFMSLVGYRVAEWREGHAVLVLDVEPKHLNRSGVVHGGVPATLIDSVCGYAGCYCPVPGRVRRATTLSLTVNFVAPTRTGTLRAVGTVTGGGRRTWFTRGEVFDEAGTLIASGVGTFRYRTGSENPEGIPAEQAGHA